MQDQLIALKKMIYTFRKGNRNSSESWKNTVEWSPSNVMETGSDQYERTGDRKKN